MAEGRGTFGKSMQTSGELHHMLIQENITPEILFAVSNISGDIKQNIEVFLNFCLKNREFTTRLLTITFNSSYQDLQQEDVKKVAQYSIDVLTNDEDALVSFLFNKKPETNNSEEVTEKIEGEVTETIESEAERLFNDSPTKKEEALWEKKQDAFDKFELVSLTLAHLNEKEKNETCLGYLNKLYSSLLRREGNLFLEFLKEKPENISLLINNINHFSIGNMVALLVSCEDKSGEYKHENIKKEIFNQILQYGFNNIENEDNFYGFLSSIEEIMNSTKQSYYEYFEDFKRCANILVSEETLKKFYSFLSKTETSFNNSSSYLDLILKRINSELELEEHDYYKQSENNEPTMNFQHHFLFQEINHLLTYIETSSKYNSLTKVTFLEFLINLFKNIKEKQTNLTNTQIFQEILVNILIYPEKHFNQEPNNGIIKNYLFQLLKISFKRMSKEEIESCEQLLLNANTHEQVNLNSVYEANSSVIKNNNQNSCFIVDILFEFQKKNNQFLEKYSEKNQVNLSETFDKFKIKLADYGEDEPQSPSCDQVELTLKFTKEGNSLFLPSKKEEESQEAQLVGKNNVMIPVLNLPNKLEFTKITIEEEEVEKVKIPSELTREDIIRDLKNTRIELSSKFKLKKVSEPTENDVEEKKEIKKPFKLEIPDEEEVVEVIQSKLEHPTKPKIPESPVFVQIETDPNEKKYFIKHILLF